MDFYPNSEITVGNFKFQGVHQVRVRRSIHSAIDMATITVPNKALIKRGNGEPVDANTGDLMKPGDAVRIDLGWNGELVNEFSGFVTRVGKGLPVLLECEGYSYLMRKNISVSRVLEKTTVKEVLEYAIGKRDGSGKLLKQPKTPIELECTVDIPLVGVLMSGANGMQLVEHVKRVTDGNVVVFFITPTRLWAGLPYTAYSRGNDPYGNGTVAYRPGYNCIKDGALKLRTNIEPVSVNYYGKYATKQKVYSESSAKYAAQRYKHMLNMVDGKQSLQLLGNERESRYNYSGYDGRITGFLQPFCAPGYAATIKNTDYPEMDGKYMVEAVEVQFGVNGARRMVQVGPSIGFFNR